MLPQHWKIFNDVFLLINFTKCNYLLIAEKHVAATLQNFYRCILLIILQKCNFIKDHHRLPEDGPDGPKHVGENV
jgi:hypothetical protein